MLKKSGLPFWALLALVGVTSLGAFLRLHHLSQRGPINGDEATTILHARQWMACGKLFAQKFGFYKAQTQQELLNYINLHGWSAYDAKAANAFFRAIGLWLFGDTVYGATLPIAILAILTIPVLFFFTQRLLADFRVSLVAAMLLAISPSGVFYGRGFKAEADSMLFLLLALWCYYEGSQRYRQPHAPRWIWASGWLTGIAVSCNGRAVDFPAIFLLIILAEKFSLRRPILAALGNYFRILAGISMVLVFWELPYHWAMVTARETGLSFNSQFYTYWEALLIRREMTLNAYHSGFGWPPDGLQAYLYLACRYEGPTAILALLGFGRSVWSKKRFPLAFILAPVVVGFIFFWSAMSHPYYLYSFSIPELYLLAAIGFCWLGDRWLWAEHSRTRIIALWALIAVIITWSGWASWEAVKLRSRMAEAMDWLKQNHPNAVAAVTTYSQALCEYDNAHVVPLLQMMHPSDFDRAYPQIQFLVVDPPEKFVNCVAGVVPLDQSLLPNAEAFATPFNAFENTTQPVATFTNVYDRMGFFFLGSQMNYSLARTRLFLKCYNSKIDSVIRIYNVRDVMQALRPTTKLIFPDNNSAPFELAR